MKMFLFILTVLFASGCATYQPEPDYTQNDLVYFQGEWYYEYSPLIHISTKMYEEIEK